LSYRSGFKLSRQGKGISSPTNTDSSPTPLGNKSIGTAPTWVSFGEQSRINFRER